MVLVLPILFCFFRHYIRNICCCKCCVIFTCKNASFLVIIVELSAIICYFKLNVCAPKVISYHECKLNLLFCLYFSHVLPHPLYHHLHYSTIKIYMNHTKLFTNIKILHNKLSSIVYHSQP